MVRAPVSFPLPRSVEVAVEFKTERAVINRVPRAVPVEVEPLTPVLTPQLKYDVTYLKTEKVLSQPQLYQDTSRLEAPYGRTPFPLLILDDVMLDDDTSLALSFRGDTKNLAPPASLLFGSVVVEADASPLYRPLSTPISMLSPTNAELSPLLYGSGPVNEEQLLYTPDTDAYDLSLFRSPTSSLASRGAK
jgi:hypothetical protein